MMKSRRIIFFLQTTMAHLAILSAYFFDGFRRSTSGWETYMYSGLSALLCITAVIYFFKAPERLIFLDALPRSSDVPIGLQSKISVIKRMLVWAFVLSWPIVWFIFGPSLPRIAAGYSLLICIAISARYFGYLFAKSDAHL